MVTAMENYASIHAHQVDVLVVGSGVAGLSAAVAAAMAGQSVVVIEKSTLVGGTARYANGSIWIPDNDQARKKGIRHDPDQELRFILSACHDSFDEYHPTYGVDERTWQRADRYIRQGQFVIRELEKTGVQKFGQLDFIFRSMFFSSRDSIAAAETALENKISDINQDLNRAARSSWDYHWHNSHNVIPYGKHIWANIDPRATTKFLGQGVANHFGHIAANLFAVRSINSIRDQLPKLFGKFWGFGHGLILAERFRRRLRQLNVQILTEHAIADVEVDGLRVQAVEVQTPGGEIVRWRLKNALILASGCSTHQLRLSRVQNNYPVRSVCVTPKNEGDAVRIMSRYDVAVDSEPRPLLAQSVLQLAIDRKGVSHEPVFFLYGDSFFVVDRHGRRILNEKLNYHDRALHHTAGADRELMFLVGDRRFVERNWGFGIGLPFDRRYLIKATNAAELQNKIESELKRFEVNFDLADDFASNLEETRDQFNSYAREGIDPDFGRGTNAYDVLGFPKPDHDNDCPSRTMYPLTGDDLYSCIYCLSAFSTHGGLKVDVESRLISQDDSTWKNAYAVGTCAASFMNGRYPSHGMSLGSAVVFGYLAGLHASGIGSSI